MWCRDQVLKETFSDLYSIACVKDAFVANYLELSSVFHQWNISFIKVALDRDWTFCLVF